MSDSAAASSPAAAAASAAAPSDPHAWWARALTSSSSPVEGAAGLALCSNPTGGRFLRVGNGAEAGSEILSETVPLASLNAQGVDERCAWCWSLLPTGESKRCAGCRAVRYCSVACQKLHWNRAHKLQCSVLRPYSSRPRENHPIYLPNLWLVCQIALGRLARPLAEARLSAEEASSGSSPTSRSTAADSRHAELDRSLQPFEEWYQRFEHNVDNLSLHSSDEVQRYGELATLVREVTLYACNNAAERELHARLLPLDWMVRTFARLTCNVFTVVDDELRPMGHALFPSANMINHSCQPNAIAQFDVSAGVRVSIRAIRRIEAGQEVNISYVGLAQSAAVRQRKLRQEYFFECDCKRCSAASDQGRSSADQKVRDEWLRNKRMDALKCAHKWRDDVQNYVPGESAGGTSANSSGANGGADSSNSKPCGGILLSNPSSPVYPRCSDCGRAHNLLHIQPLLQTEVLPHLAAVDSLKAQLDRSGRRISPQRLDAMAGTLRAAHAALSAAFNPLSTQLYLLYEQQLRVALERQQWSEAREAAAASLPLYEFYFAGLDHPLVALQHLMHAKLAWLLEDAQAALNSWQRALPTLLLSHGESHSLVRELKENIWQAQMEIRQGKSGAASSSSRKQIKARMEQLSDSSHND